MGCDRSENISAVKCLADMLQVEIGIGQFDDPIWRFMFQCQAKNTIIGSDKVATGLFEENRFASTANPRVDHSDVNGAGGKELYRMLEDQGGSQDVLRRYAMAKVDD